MRAEDLLPNHLDHGDFNGTRVRKGTVGAFLISARLWLDPGTPAEHRRAAEEDLLAALPALRALGLFELMRLRDPALRALCGQD
ncbi:hypothetical protein ACQKQA_05885 [Pseudomonas sp. NPDC089530]|uniref:hypothetical protein n=1 Tax=Pseudomonas sp. NPDC089530 TaxID=3390651 RepID=UPI003D06188C